MSSESTETNAAESYTVSVTTPAYVQYTIAPFTSSQSTVTTIAPTLMTLAPNGNDITQEGDFDLIVHGRQRVAIRFMVTDGTGNDCAVVGIAMDLTSGTTPPSSAFPTAVINYNSLVLADHNPANASYDFYLLVQNSQGNLGLIDPKISNQ